MSKAFSHGLIRDDLGEISESIAGIGYRQSNPSGIQSAYLRWARNDLTSQPDTERTILPDLGSIDL